MNLPKAGYVYLHYKGGMYVVNAIETRAESGQLSVSYSSLNGKGNYNRLVSDWNKPAIQGDKEIVRFKELGLNQTMREVFKEITNGDSWDDYVKHMSKVPRV